MSGFFDSIFPVAAGIGADFLLPGSGPLVGAAVTGGTSYAKTGNLGQGLAAGALSYGLGSALGSLSSTGDAAGQAASEGASGPAGEVQQDLARSAQDPLRQNFSQAGADTIHSALGNAPTSQIAPPSMSLSSIASGAQQPGGLQSALMNRGTAVPLGIGALGMMNQQGPMPTASPGPGNSDPFASKRNPMYSANRMGAMPSGYQPGMQTPNFFPGFAKGGGIGAIHPEGLEDLHTLLDANLAMRGQHPDPTGAFRRFTSRFGAPRLNALKRAYAIGGHVLPRNDIGDEGQLRGSGGGMDDTIPASMHGKDAVRLANDEFIIPADVVADLGDGSSDHGSTILHKMMDRVRMQKHGTKNQPHEIDLGKVLPA